MIAKARGNLRQRARAVLQPRGRGLVERRDLKKLASTFGGIALASVLPQRLDGALVGTLDALGRRRPSRERTLLVEAMERTLGPSMPGRDFRPAVAEHYRMRSEISWQRTRGMRGQRMRHRIPIDGIERLREGLEAGRGVILWRMNFGSTMWLQAACQQAGHPAVQLSDASHGASSYSHAGFVVLPRMYVRAENIYLRERVVIPPDRSLGYMTRLIELLEANAVVAMRGDLPGRQPVPATLFGEPFPLATGGPSLAWRTGAALLTAYTVRDAPLRYRLIVDEPVEVDRGRPRRAAVTSAVHEFAARLEERVRRHPSNWMGWYGRLDRGGGDSRA